MNLLFQHPNDIIFVRRQPNETNLDETKKPNCKKNIIEQAFQPRTSNIGIDDAMRCDSIASGWRISPSSIQNGSKKEVVCVARCDACVLFVSNRPRMPCVCSARHLPACVIFPKKDSPLHFNLQCFAIISPLRGTHSRQLHREKKKKTQSKNRKLGSKMDGLKLRDSFDNWMCCKWSTHFWQTEFGFHHSQIGKFIFEFWRCCLWLLCFLRTGDGWWRAAAIAWNEWNIISEKYAEINGFFLLSVGSGVFLCVIEPDFLWQKDEVFFASRRVLLLDCLHAWMEQKERRKYWSILMWKIYGQIPVWLMRGQLFGESRQIRSAAGVFED